MDAAFKMASLLEFVCISGKDTAFDVTVVNPLQTQMLEPHSKAATHPHYACDFRYGEKMTKHGEPCRLAGMVFVPLVVETLGGWEEQGEKQIRRMGAALARQTGQDEAVKTRHLFQRLSILLTKGNAALFLNRLPSHPGPTIDGEQ